MNKKYITPATEVVSLNVQQMLAASNPNIKMSTDSDDRHDAEGFDTRKHTGVGSGLWSDMK